MNKFKKAVPSVLTLFNLTCGMMVMFSMNTNWFIYFMLLALFFDVIDGIVARALNAQSEFGKQLDSLADIVSFGVAPAVVVLNSFWMKMGYFQFAVILIPIFSAIRLAKFNIDDRQNTSFRGLPTPASGLFFAFMPFLKNNFLVNISGTMIIMLILFFSFLMVSNIRMFAFKNIRAGGVDTFFPLILLSLVIIGIFFLGFMIIPLGVLLYILLSIGYHYFTTKETTNIIN